MRPKSGDTDGSAAAPIAKESCRHRQSAGVVQSDQRGDPRAPQTFVGFAVSPGQGRESLLSMPASGWSVQAFAGTDRNLAIGPSLVHRDCLINSTVHDPDMVTCAPESLVEPGVGSNQALARSLLARAGHHRAHLGTRSAAFQARSGTSISSAPLIRSPPEIRRIPGRELCHFGPNPQRSIRC